MYLKYCSSYITGLTHMASYCSKQIGPSFVIADCFEKSNYIKEFSNVYDISEESIEFANSKFTLEELLKTWFGDDEIVQGLIYWIKFKAGNPKKVLEISENCNICDILSSSSGGNTPFYTLENIYFVEFEKMVICFMIGDNE